MYFSDAGNTVFVDSERSAAPPTIVGTTGSNAAMILPPALRVATFVPTSNFGSTSATGDDRPGRPRGVPLLAQLGVVERHASKRSCHSACSRSPRSGANAS